MPSKIMKLLYGINGKGLGSRTWLNKCDDADVITFWWEIKKVKGKKKRIRRFKKILMPNDVAKFVRAHGYPGKADEKK